MDYVCIELDDAPTLMKSQITLYSSKPFLHNMLIAVST